MGGRVAHRLAAAAPSACPALPRCMQVNLADVHLDFGCAAGIRE